MDNKIARPVIIIWTTLFTLFFLSFIKLPVVPYLNNYSSIDILQDIKEIKKTAPIVIKATPKILPAAAAVPGLVATDFDSTAIADYATDSVSSIRGFFKKLRGLKTSKGKVRIAYFGDSFIEADYVTAELRSRLQQLYGGNGVGFVPVQSIVADSYESIHFSNSSWTDYNFHNNPKKLPLGLTGHVFYSNGDSWCQYGAVNSKFPGIYLYTGKAQDANTVVTVEKDGAKNEIAVNNNANINQTVLQNNGALKKFKFSCANKNLPVYGLSIEDSTGVYVDNYGFRGNTGGWSLKVPDEVFSGFKKYLDYDLIIVHYGLNAVEHGQSNFSWFNNYMDQLIKKIRLNYPSVPILMISTSDIGYKENDTYATEPAVPVLVQEQNETAKKNGTAFWNLFYAMGGFNTITKWAEADTALAEKDYMHLKERGADKIAGILFDKLQIEAKKN
jgi:lysophospholipase L1-like esterase